MKPSRINRHILNPDNVTEYSITTALRSHVNFHMKMRLKWHYRAVLTLLRLCVNVRTVPLCTQGALLPTYRGLLKRV